MNLSFWEAVKKDILACTQTCWASNDGMALSLQSPLSAGMVSCLNSACVKLQLPLSLRVLTFVVGGRSGPLPALPDRVGRARETPG